jgi:molybdopterin molybdotransferase
MDGYAVRSVDTQSASTRLRLTGTMAAGNPPTGSVSPGTALRIFTGAPLPSGADAVVMQEDVVVDPDGLHIRVLEPVTPWENVRFRGEDVPPGATLVSAGLPLGPQHLAVLLASGIERIEVHRAPRVILIANGSELRPAGVPLAAGQIYESNTAMLASLVRRAGAIPIRTHCVTDDPVQLRNTLEAAFAEADAVVTVGGASVGDHDLVRSALVAAGGIIDFWRVAIKPGKPFLHGQLHGKPLFGLPGNPVSAFVTAVVLLLPALRRLQGIIDCRPPTRPAIWRTAVENPDTRRHFVRVVTDEEGRIQLSGQQGSHRMASLAAADGLVDLPPGSRHAAGAPARVLCW